VILTAINYIMKKQQKIKDTIGLNGREYIKHRGRKEILGLRQVP
jgi:hypothetical protein